MSKARERWTDLDKHKPLHGLIPLQQNDPRLQRSTQVLMTRVWVPHYETNQKHNQFLKREQTSTPVSKRTPNLIISKRENVGPRPRWCEIAPTQPFHSLIIVPNTSLKVTDSIQFVSQYMKSLFQMFQSLFRIDTKTEQTADSLHSTFIIVPENFKSSIIWECVLLFLHKTIYIRGISQNRNRHNHIKLTKKRICPHLYVQCGLKKSIPGPGCLSKKAFTENILKFNIEELDLD